jgi:response regulator NasT
MRSLIVIFNRADRQERHQDERAFEAFPETALRRFGYRVIQAANEPQARAGIPDAEAAVLDLPVSDCRSWVEELFRWKRLPILWWCGDSSAARSREACEEDVAFDGILTPGMAGHEVHWALHLGVKQFYLREQWLEERRQLLAKVEERKWIDMAKGILCEIKNISESEAYDLLRRQAMNERKRLVDVATSIVKVYELLQDAKQKGTRRK